MPNKNTSISTEGQHSIIVKELRKGPKNTFDLRDEGVVQVSTRVLELRERGVNIVSYWTRVDLNGENRRIGEYALLPGKWKPHKGRVKLAASDEDACRDAD